MDQACRPSLEAPNYYLRREWSIIRLAVFLNLCRCFSVVARVSGGCQGWMCGRFEDDHNWLQNLGNRRQVRTMHVRKRVSDLILTQAAFGSDLVSLPWITRAIQQAVSAIHVLCCITGSEQLFRSRNHPNCYPSEPCISWTWGALPVSAYRLLYSDSAVISEHYPSRQLQPVSAPIFWSLFSEHYIAALLLFDGVAPRITLAFPSTLPVSH